MGIGDDQEQGTIADGSDSSPEAPWGINPTTQRPYTKSPEERAAIGATLAAARQAKAAARQAQAGTDQAARGPAPDGQAAPVDRSTPDREPGRGRRRRGKSIPDQSGGKFSSSTPAEIPPFRAGPIAKGMNRLYAKAGKIVRTVHPALGEAILACTRKESDDDVTVGEAWEEIAKTNPVWRGRLLKLVSGGAWGQLFWAHAPVALALLMMDPIKRRLPFPDLVDAVLSDDDGRPPADPLVPTGAQLQDMMAMATQMMGPLLATRSAPNGARVIVEEPGWYPDAQEEPVAQPAAP